MKRTAVLATSALALALLTGLTACGGGDSDTDAAGKPGAGATASKAEEVSPADRLAKLMITKAELKDAYEVEEPATEYAFAKSQDEVTVDKKECAPLAYALNQLPLGETTADLTRVTSKDANGYTYVTLNTYADGGAESAMADLSKSVSSCGGGFTAEAKGNSSPYDSVAAEQADKAGDESLAFKSTMTFQGTTHTMHSAAVRRGDVVAVYFAVDGRALAEGRPSDTELATTVVKTQNAKLG
ncbi:hypothetical protein C6Y14_34940 [Streptomyces dioscori]|uniref:PknH-like extracellular domain-containing protein n=1 Tax=Streptomyces dioscori TaxID=2109333 RepID=A0A2P8PXQ1_9ACTN|nr:hypothetical protein [Streptomyces dioscori]PSM38776.1 hypothetical protein C6Y14_34940 [Streptomyces dioscori]